MSALRNRKNRKPCGNSAGAGEGLAAAIVGADGVARTAGRATLLVPAPRSALDARAPCATAGAIDFVPA